MIAVKTTALAVGSGEGTGVHSQVNQMEQMLKAIGRVCRQELAPAGSHCKLSLTFFVSLLVITNNPSSYITNIYRLLQPRG